MSDTQKINDAWYEEASIKRLGMMPSGDPAIIAALTPSGGEWTCVAPEGAITRSVMWGTTEVCLVNPKGDLADYIEGQIAMALRAAPVMDKALRCIFVLANNPANCDLIGRIARSAIAHVEVPAPPIKDGSEDEEEPQDDE